MALLLLWLSPFPPVYFAVLPASIQAGQIPLSKRSSFIHVFLLGSRIKGLSSLRLPRDGFSSFSGRGSPGRSGGACSARFAGASAAFPPFAACSFASFKQARFVFSYIFSCSPQNQGVPKLYGKRRDFLVMHANGRYNDAETTDGPKRMEEEWETHETRDRIFIEPGDAFGGFGPDRSGGGGCQGRGGRFARILLCTAPRGDVCILRCAPVCAGGQLGGRPAVLRLLGE